MYNPQSWPQSLLLESQIANPTFIVTSAMYSAGALPLNGAGASGGNYLNVKPAFLTVTSDANDSATNITVSFKDASGRTYSPTFAGPNNTTITLSIPVYMILAGGITIDQNSVGNLSIGISSQTATPWVPFDLNRTEFNNIIEVTLSNGATLTYSVEYTNQNALTTFPTRILEDQTLASQTVSGSTIVPNSVCFGRLRFSAWTSGNAVADFITSGAYASFKNF